MLLVKKLKEKWEREGIDSFHPIDIEYIQNFQRKNNVILPNDLKEYFNTLNGTGDECTNELYEFYSLERIKKVSEEFQDWKGVPNYQSLVNLNDTQNLFVIANFCFNLFAYAIKLYQEKVDTNEVYVLCGEETKKIANSFAEFIELYLNDSIELQL
ncbi:MAG TPA: SMI1/KNR4 family protein [Cytophagaceae bacterium]|jgi:hypothetical protein|nr:SMI1/KNR4 family protein [Cytophagaceae bacterium]